jgi:hypothetical protein
MNAQDVLYKLRNTGYVFTTAHRIRAEIKKMDDDDRDRLYANLKLEVFNPQNADLVKAIKEILR